MLGRDVDDRSDVFGLGVILYEMTTGRRPYASEASVDLLRMLARRPVRADVDDVRVPAALADAIAKSLEIDAADRFQSAADLARALDAVERELTKAPAILPAESISRRVARFALFLSIVPICIFILGFICIAGFNNTFGRTGGFGLEPFLDTCTGATGRSSLRFSVSWRQWSRCHW
jgi:serine/threonine protein kinase